MFADVIRNPTFPQAEVDKYKTRTLAQLQLQRSIPQFLAAEQFQSDLRHEPSGFVDCGAGRLDQEATSKDLADFHSTYYRPNNAIIAIVGDVTMKEICRAREGVWRLAEGRCAVDDHSASAAQSESRIYLIDRPGSVQTVLQLGTLGIERTSPDYFAVLLADRVLGGGPSGRLFLNLREDKGYTYASLQQLWWSKFKGTWISSSEVRTDVTEGAMKEFMYELNRLRNDMVPAEELENAKRAIVGSFALTRTAGNSLAEHHHAEALQPARGLLGYVSAEGFGNHGC